MFLAGDGSLRYGEIVAVIDAAKGAGVEKVGIVTQACAGRLASAATDVLSVRLPLRRPSGSGPGGRFLFFQLTGHGCSGGDWSAHPRSGGGCSPADGPLRARPASPALDRCRPSRLLPDRLNLPANAVGRPRPCRSRRDGTRGPEPAVAAVRQGRSMGSAPSARASVAAGRLSVAAVRALEGLKLRAVGGFRWHRGGSSSGWSRAGGRRGASGRGPCRAGP